MKWTLTIKQVYFNPVKSPDSVSDPVVNQMAGWRVRAALLLLALLALLGAGALVYETWYDDFAKRSHYEALGVATNAPLREIKRAFRERSLQFHPDKSATGTTELSTKRFHRISGTSTAPCCLLHTCASSPVSWRLTAVALAQSY